MPYIAGSRKLGGIKISSEEAKLRSKKFPIREGTETCDYTNESKSQVLFQSKSNLVELVAVVKIQL